MSAAMDHEESLPNAKGPPSVTAFWTSTRAELHAELQNAAPDLADLYEASVRLLFEATFPGRVRFIAHGVREIRNRLPDVLAGPRGGRLDYTSRMDQIAESWERSGLSLDGSLPGSASDPDSTAPPPTDVTLPRGVVGLVAELIAEHTRTRRKPFDAAARLFQALDPENAALQEQLRPVISHWLEITDWFVDKVHQPALVVNQDEGELQSRFKQFESVLSSLFRGFFQTTEELDEILADANA